jgi:F-type H+-transporting ATPase subunit epsilon
MQVKIVSASQEIYRTEDATEVYVPTTDGIIGILPHHTNLITSLNIGLLRIKFKDLEEKQIVLNGGIMQVHENVVSVLADEAQLADDLVNIEIEKAIQDAEQKLSGTLEPTELIQLERQLRYERFKNNLIKN